MDHDSLIDRINSAVEQFDDLNHDETADAWAVAGSVVGELAGIAKGASAVAEELRRQVARLEERVQTLEIREVNLLDELLGQRRPAS